ncbi:MAG: hypothetical protein CBC29_06575 [Methylococcaceae bacterium TMED69]|nr:MAG: hypothetical protein CBC29_06575 [Methylococcaceae bacterium TMED69]
MKHLREYIRQILLESISLDVDVGDVILTGRFKNKRTIVKKIGKDKHGHPTINGKSILKFKIEKQLPVKKRSAKTRKELNEAMVDPASAATRMAMWSSYYGDVDVPDGIELDFVMYDIEGAKQTLENEIDSVMENYDPNEGMRDDYIADYTFDIINQSIIENIMAVLRVRTPGRYGPCNKAWEVIRSAAEPGYGPTIYDAVMSIAPNGLTSDRSSVSSQAQSVWKFYADNRDDVEKQYLDDEEIEITYKETDDCLLNGHRSADAIKKAMKDLFMDWFVNNYQEWYEFGKVMDNGEWETLDPDEILNDIEVMARASKEAQDIAIDEIEEDYGESYEDIIQTIREEWYEEKVEAEHSGSFFDDYPPGGDDAGYELNLSYNTDSSMGAFEQMSDNHYSFIELSKEKELDFDLIEEFAGEGPGLLVRDFFSQKY